MRNFQFSAVFEQHIRVDVDHFRAGWWWVEDVEGFWNSIKCLHNLNFRTTQTTLCYDLINFIHSFIRNIIYANNFLSSCLQKILVELLISSIEGATEKVKIKSKSRRKLYNIIRTEGFLVEGEEGEEVLNV